MKFTPMTRFDSLFDEMFPTFDSSSFDMMKTDIRELDDKYVLDVDLPGYQKEDIKISLDHGNLTVSAEHHDDHEEKDEEGRVIRKERFDGSYTRSFYLGNSISEDQITANFENGTLNIELPKITENEIESKHYIEIE